MDRRRNGWSRRWEEKGIGGEKVFFEEGVKILLKG